MSVLHRKIISCTTLGAAARDRPGIKWVNASQPTHVVTISLVRNYPAHHNVILIGSISGSPKPDTRRVTGRLTATYRPLRWKLIHQQLGRLSCDSRSNSRSVYFDFGDLRLWHVPLLAYLMKTAPESWQCRLQVNSLHSITRYIKWSHSVHLLIFRKMLSNDSQRNFCSTADVSMTSRNPRCAAMDV